MQRGGSRHPLPRNCCTPSVPRLPCCCPARWRRRCTTIGSGEALPQSLTYGLASREHDASLDRRHIRGVAVTRFSRDRMIDEYVEVYRTVLSERR